MFFIVSTLLIYFFLDYHNILFYRPQSIHFMRQTDSLSFVVTYFNQGMDFLEPRVLNLGSIDGKAMGEFPILYYLTAVLYKIFGEHEFFLRLINLAIMTTGLLYLYKLLIKLLSDVVYALAFTFLFFSSTILIYYTNNYLPDAGALGLTLIGWYYFYEFFENRKKTRAFVLSIFFFTLASLIKITYGLNLSAALLSLVVFGIINNREFPFRKTYPCLLLFLFGFIIITGWYCYVIRYNEINNVESFLLRHLPIWSLNEFQTAIVWDYISNFWYTKYYYESTIHVFALIIITGLFFIKKSNTVILTFALTTTIGSLVYFALFFQQFKNHDYYFIALVPAIAFLVIGSFISIRNRCPKIIGNIFFKLALIALVVLSLNYARKKVIGRYETKDDKFANIGRQLDNAQEYINSIGMDDDAKIIVICDFTPNGSLYFLNRRGWTLPDTSSAKLKNIPEYIGQGASYLFLTDKNYLENRTIKSMVQDIAGEHNGIVIYNLKK